MNLKLKRVARTPYSEEITIFDADTRDANGDAVNIGKLDVHYVGDQLVGTLLIWQEYATGFQRTHGQGSDTSMDEIIDSVLTEVSEPLGVASDYGIEVYYPSVSNHYFVSNYATEDEEDTDTDEDAGASSDEARFSEQIRQYGGGSGGRP